MRKAYVVVNENGTYASYDCSTMAGLEARRTSGVMEIITVEMETPFTQDDFTETMESVHPDLEYKGHCFLDS